MAGVADSYTPTNGDMLMKTGAGVSGLTDFTPYFAVNVRSLSFNLSGTRGGAPIKISNSGGPSLAWGLQAFHPPAGDFSHDPLYAVQFMMMANWCLAIGGINPDPTPFRDNLATRLAGLGLTTAIGGLRYTSQATF